MSKNLDKLNELTNKYGLGLVDGSINEDNYISYMTKIVDCASDVYADEEGYVYMPFFEDNCAMYPEDAGLYFAIYSDKKLIKNPKITNVKKISFKKLFDETYENKIIYGLADHPENIYKHGCDYSKKDVDDYISKHIRVSGIMYNPGTKYVFGFEDWLLDGVIFKGMGIDDVEFVNSKTGKVEAKI